MKRLSRRVTGFVAALVAFSGCLGEGDARDEAGTDTPGPPLPEGTPIEVHLADCTEQMGVFPAPPDQFDGLLPPGFEPVPFHDAATMATMYSFVVSCMFRGEEMREFSMAVQVTPPAACRTEEVEMYMVLVGGFTSHPELFAAYRAWGIERDFGLGDVAIEYPTAANPVVRIGTANGAAEHGTATLSTQVPTTPASYAADRMRMFHVAHGSNGLRGAFDILWTAYNGTTEGTATLAFDGGPPSAGLGFHFWGPGYDTTMRYVPLDG